MPGRQQNFTRPHIIAPGNDIAARRHRFKYFQHVVVGGYGVFQHYHRVGARRQQTAGGDPVTFGGRRPVLGHFPHFYLTADGQVGGQVGRGPEGVGSPDRIAVHHRTGMDRQILRRRNGRGAEAIQGLAGGNLLGGQAGMFSQHPRQYLENLGQGGRSPAAQHISAKQIGGRVAELGLVAPGGFGQAFIRLGGADC